MQRGSATSGSGSSGKLQIWLLAAWRSRPALVLVLATSPRNRGNGNHLRCFSRHRGSTRGYMTFVSGNSLGYIIIYNDIYIYIMIFFLTQAHRSFTLRQALSNSAAADPISLRNQDQSYFRSLYTTLAYIGHERPEKFALSRRLHNDGVLWRVPVPALCSELVGTL